MSVEISFGGICRDISKLPGDSAQLQNFFMNKIAPAIWEDFSKNVAMTMGNVDMTRGADVVLEERGCEIGGSVTIRL